MFEVHWKLFLNQSSSFSSNSTNVDKVIFKHPLEPLERIKCTAPCAAQPGVGQGTIDYVRKKNEDSITYNSSMHKLPLKLQFLSAIFRQTGNLSFKNFNKTKKLMRLVFIK